MKNKILVPIVVSVIKGIDTLEEVTEDKRINFFEGWRLVKVTGEIFQALKDAKGVDFSEISENEINASAVLIHVELKEDTRITKDVIYNVLLGVKHFASAGQELLKK
jgi:hypothetical protein